MLRPKLRYWVAHIKSILLNLKEDIDTYQDSKSKYIAAFAARRIRPYIEELVCVNFIIYTLIDPASTCGFLIQQVLDKNPKYIYNLELNKNKKQTDHIISCLTKIYNFIISPDQILQLCELYAAISRV
jgi:hypothetical protein